MDWLDRISGLATVPLQAPNRSVRVLRNAVGMDLKEIMIFSNVSGAYLDDSAQRPSSAAPPGWG